MRETSNLLDPVAVESGMMPPPGLQIYLRPRMSLTFDPWTSKLIVSLLAAIGVKIAVTGRNAPHSRQKNRAVHLSDHIFIQPQKLPMSIRAKFELPTSIRFEDIMGFNSGPRCQVRSHPMG